MGSNYILHAVFPNQRASLDQEIARIIQFLGRLSSVHQALGNWQAYSPSGNEIRYEPTLLGMQELVRTSARHWMTGTVQRTTYQLRFQTRSPHPSVKLSIVFGTDLQGLPKSIWMPGAVVVELPCHRHDLPINLDIVGRALVSVVDVYRPEWAVVGQKNFPSIPQPGPRPAAIPVGWLTYVSRDAARLPTVPPPSSCAAIGEHGFVLIAQQEPSHWNNQTHQKTRKVLVEALKNHVVPQTESL